MFPRLFFKCFVFAFMKVLVFLLPTSKDTKTSEISQKIKILLRIAGTIFCYPSSQHDEAKNNWKISLLEVKALYSSRSLANFMQILPAR